MSTPSPLQNIYGSALIFPFRVDRRGTLATTKSPAEIVRQELIALLSTRQGERVMMPSYGLPDLLFEIVDAGFAHRLSYLIQEQVRWYVPMVATLDVRVEVLAPQQVDVMLDYTIRGSNAPQNLVYPLWRLTT